MVTMSREWAMPNSNTFTIPPIKKLIEKHIVDGVTVDPFARGSKLCKITNDLDPRFKTTYNMEALDFLKMLESNSTDFLLFDPPYSPRQVTEVYRMLGKSVSMHHTQASYWGNLKKEIARVVKPKGKVITFGWNSGGIGKSYGFIQREVLLVAHGGNHNDTICVVESNGASYAKN